ncbi:MAG TPA: hypothetical protein VJT75_06610 [Thermoleophilaceae bacterium]|nr:hypothetical protein [Thermoleophilaceae bacterium]
MGRRAAVGVACAAVALAGCSGDRDSDEGRKVEAVVKRFSLASGPDACSLMTPKALTTVYGRGSLDPAVAKARCVKESKRFSGQPVTITFVKINDSDTAHATARTPGGRRYFSVGLEKHGGRWLINTVAPRPRP